MPSSTCSRGSIENPDTGRCKKVTSFTKEELKSIARQQKVSTAGTKADLEDRLLRKFRSKMGKSKSRSRSSSRTRYSRDTNTIYVGHHSTSRRGKSRSPSQRRARRRNVSYTRGGTRIVRSPRSYRRSGQGSLQSRHSKSTRKGPLMPAVAHAYERAMGNDGRMWESRPSGKSFRWYRL